MLLVASILVLLLLSSFAIRSNLDTRMLVVNRSRTNPNPTDRVSRKNRRPFPSKKRISTNIPGHFELVETTHTEEITPEDPLPDQPDSVSSNDAPSSDPIIAKLILVEVFKAESFSSFSILRPCCVVDRHQFPPGDRYSCNHQPELDQLDAFIALHSRFCSVVCS